MNFLPIELMMRRVETNSADSDALRFAELLYAGEFILKLTTAAFVSAVEDDVESNRYRLLHALVRADGIGDWASRLDDVLTGPASQHISPALQEHRRVFNERVDETGWQYEAVYSLQAVLEGVHAATPQLPTRVTLRSWFTKFAELRNKTRGHGATTPATCAKLIPAFQKAVDLSSLKTIQFSYCLGLTYIGIFLANTGLCQSAAIKANSLNSVLLRRSVARII